MSAVSARDIVTEAAEGGYAVGAFNITDVVQMEAVVEAAVEKRAPVIIQTSVKPSKFLRPDVLVAVYRTLAETAPVPVCLHLDHCADLDHCKKCADAGYTNIMIDASQHDYRGEHPANQGGLSTTATRSVTSQSKANWARWAESRTS